MNCKPGDLAIIINATRCPENIGRIVTVLRHRMGDWDYSDFMPEAGQWIVRSNGGALASKNDAGDMFYDMEGPYRDAYLRPIRPASLDDSLTDHREKETS
jgi:hypothetical protein